MSGNKLLWLSLLIATGSACSPKTRVVKPVYPAEKSERTEKKEVKTAPDKPAAGKWLGATPAISLILPFGSKTINREQPAAADLSKADLAIQYYRGFKLGLDAVAAADGQDITLRVFDSGDDYNKLLALSRNPGLRTSDVIVGPVFPAGIKTFSAFSGSIRRPLISPLSASPPSEFQNPYLITFTVPLEMHAREAAVFTTKNLRPARILVLRSGSSEELKYSRPYRQMIDSLLKNSITVTDVVIKSGDIERVLSSMTTTGNNVIVIPSTSKTFVDAALRGLDKIAHRYPVSVIGHPLWEKTAGMNTTLLTRLNTRITTSSRIDYRDPQVIRFVRDFRDRFKSEPNEYAFKGFEAAAYFGKMLSENGTGFTDDLSENPAKGLSNNLEWEKTPYGWVNNHVFVLRYDNLQLKTEE